MEVFVNANKYNKTIADLLQRHQDHEIERIAEFRELFKQNCRFEATLRQQSFQGFSRRKF